MLWKDTPTSNRVGVRNIWQLLVGRLTHAFAAENAPMVFRLELPF